MASRATMGPGVATLRRHDRGADAVGTTAALGVLALAVVVLGALAWGAAPALTSPGPPAGVPILTLLRATAVTCVVALVVAVPLGVGVGVFLTTYAPPWLARPAAATIDLLAAVPSIVYGIWAVAVVLGPVDDAAGALGLRGETVTAFVAGMVLAVMISPVVTSMARETFAATPQDQRDGALALGATTWEMVRTTVLPYGRRGVAGAALLGLARALGEAVALMILVTSISGPLGAGPGTGGQLPLTFAAALAAAADDLAEPGRAAPYLLLALALFVVTAAVNRAGRTVLAGGRRRGASAAGRRGRGASAAGRRPRDPRRGRGASVAAWRPRDPRRGRGASVAAWRPRDLRRGR